MAMCLANCQRAQARAARAAPTERVRTKIDDLFTADRNLGAIIATTQLTGRHYTHMKRKPHPELPESAPPSSSHTPVPHWLYRLACGRWAADRSSGRG